MLPATWSSTAHGIDSPARHLFYKVPEGLAWTGGAIEGVDILQPGHRYSVVWPSIHPSGEMYCWYTPSGAFSGTLPHIGDLATLPWKWVDYLRKPDRVSNSTTLTPSYSREYDDRMCKAVNTFLNKTLANPASKGSRHDTTLQAVWALVNFAQEGHRGALDAINQLKPRFIAEVAPDRQGKEREAAPSSSNQARTASARSRSIAPSAGAATAATCAKPHASKSTARIRNSCASPSHAPT